MHGRIDPDHGLAELRSRERSRAVPPRGRGRTGCDRRPRSLRRRGSSDRRAAAEALEDFAVVPRNARHRPGVITEAATGSRLGKSERGLFAHCILPCCSSSVFATIAATASMLACSDRSAVDQEIGRDRGEAEGRYGGDPQRQADLEIGTFPHGQNPCADDVGSRSGSGEAVAGIKRQNPGGGKRRPPRGMIGKFSRHASGTAQLRTEGLPDSLPSNTAPSHEVHPCASSGSPCVPFSCWASAPAFAGTPPHPWASPSTTSAMSIPRAKRPTRPPRIESGCRPSWPRCERTLR